MAGEWHYKHGGQQIGPVAEAELKSLADAGRLSPDDLIWQDGMGEWQAAGKLKGLFASSPGVAPNRTGPPPLPPTQPESVAAKPSFLDTAKAAGQLIAKQAERTKIIQMSLPNAFQALGSNIYPAGTLRTEFPEAFDAVDRPLAGIKETDGHAIDRPKADGIAAKARAAGQTALDAAQKKKLQMQANSALTQLGKAAFEKHGEQSGPIEVVRPIIDLHSRMAALDSEIARLSQSKKGAWVTPKRLVLAAAVVCLWLVLATAYHMFSGSPGHDSDREAQQRTAVADGDRMWDAQNKDGAVEKYMVLVNGGCNYVDDDMPRVFGRLIDFSVANGDTALANKVMELAAEDDVTMVLKEPKSRAFVARAMPRILAKKKAEDAKSDLGEDDATAAPTSRRSGGSSSLRGPKGSVHFDADGNVHSSFQGDGVSGNSTIRQDGSGEAEYNVNGQKLKVKVGPDGKSSIDSEPQSVRAIKRCTPARDCHRTSHIDLIRPQGAM